MITKDFLKHKECLLCGSDALQPMEAYSKQYLVRCFNCRFVFTERIPTNQELVDHYSTYGRNDYLSPITVKRYHELLDIFEPFRKSNKIIDVGCGIGHFLSVAAERGWEVHGTEFTDEAVKICEDKGIIMQKGPLNPKNYESADFDIIVSFEVIEHINNPRDELNYFSQILRSGGAVYFTTPNFSSISRRILKSDWNVIEYPEHLSYYTPKTIDKLFTGAGFRKSWVKTTGISMTRFVGSMERQKEKKATAADNPVEDKPMKLLGEDTRDEQLRKRFEQNIFMKYLKDAINFILTVFKAGDSMKGFYIKGR